MVTQHYEYKICVLSVLVLFKDAVPLGEVIFGPQDCWIDKTFSEKMEHNTNMFMLHVALQVKFLQVTFQVAFLQIEVVFSCFTALS